MYCNNFEACRKINEALVYCQWDFGYEIGECYRDCRSCMDDFRDDDYDDEPEDFIYDGF